jgi:hypothetical protein
MYERVPQTTVSNLRRREVIFILDVCSCYERPQFTAFLQLKNPPNVEMEKKKITVAAPGL